MKKPKKSKTTVGSIDDAVLAYTAGDDVVLDRALVEPDCIGTAAHVTMLSRMKIKPPVFTKPQAARVIAELVKVMKDAADGAFRITLKDQDVHLAVERRLTKKLGDLGKKVHTARSRNDQVAVDLRLFVRTELVGACAETAALATALLKCGKRHVAVPMVGRTHMQPAMPSSVGLWAAAHAESLLDDLATLMHTYEMNDQCPLGSAAGYGVSLPIDRQKVSDLLGFSRPCHTVVYASNARGKIEALVLSAMGQVMLSLSRLAQDLMLFTMPEFGYFELPAAFGTGSSIMPQKNNPDVLELVRGRAAIVAGLGASVLNLVAGLPGGYNRDLQEAKKPLMEGLSITRASVRIMQQMVSGLSVNRQRLEEGFTPGVFATDRALDLVGQGVPFRDAYRQVKQQVSELEAADPYEAIARKTHLGATAGIDFDSLLARASEAAAFAKDERKAHNQAVSRVLGVRYPF